MHIPERDVLRESLKILRTVFKQYVKIERRQSLQFTNPQGQRYVVGKKGESDIGGWVLQGIYIAKPIAIEVKSGDFRPTHVYGADKKRFLNQCKYLRGISKDGGIAFWVNNPSMLYNILCPALFRGSRISLDVNNCVVITENVTDVITSVHTQE